jgi:pimeloyl-ACP methyl ester carboxylesterase
MCSNNYSSATISLLYGASTPRVPPEGLFLISPHVVAEDHLVNGVRATAAHRDKLISALERLHGPKAAVLFDSWSRLWQSEEMEDFDIRALLNDQLWYHGGIGNTRVPMMCVHGASDEYGTEEVQIDPLRELGAAALIVPNTGHEPHLIARRAGAKSPNQVVLDAIVAKASEWLAPFPSSSSQR